ncbi:hypothetical protein HU200_013586 [Digitaria exilis]|uniref:Reverse transcriptase zinc-binding domain-containing protein n=1 Tax=Digitaria exilis TaxID=1010633 RepID=A0A835KKW4_9POAL|nr:hypothetical protein HU200_013586 [Digitaria exilis]
MYLDSYHRVLCVENVDDDVTHLFFLCPFSSACWTYLDINWDTTLDFQTIMLRARESFGSDIFREVIIMSTCALWTHRNSILWHLSVFCLLATKFL